MDYTDKELSREEYLKKYFPRPTLREWHAPGRFTEEVCNILSHPLSVDLKRLGKQYLDINALELGGNASYEEVRFRFHLSDKPSLENLKWCEINEPLTGSLKPIYYFSFRSEYTISENVSNLFIFIAENTDDEVIVYHVKSLQIPNPPTELPSRITSDRISNKSENDYWFRVFGRFALIIYGIGIIGLISVTIFGYLTDSLIFAITSASAASIAAGEYVLRLRSINRGYNATKSNGHRPDNDSFSSIERYTK